MSFIKVWIFSLCGATVISGLIKIFLSGSSLKKSINVFLSVFVLFYTVVPFANLIDKNNFQFDYEENSSDSEEFIEEAYYMLIKKSIVDVCLENSVKVLSFDIDGYIDDDSTLVVRKITIKTDKTEKSEEIKNLLKNKLGFEVEVS